MVDYRKISIRSFYHTATLAFGDNGGFANTLDVQDANNNPNGYFSGCTLWEADTSIYARINQNGPELGSHWDMLHQSPLLGSLLRQIILIGFLMGFTIPLQI